MGQRLGQHFLKDDKILKNIVGALDIKRGGVVIEIGPGHGELTKEIIGDFEKRGIKEYKLVLIEKDPILAESVERIADNKYLKVICGDALKIIPVLNTVYGIRYTRYKLVGNIPYYITGHLLRVISELENKPELTILLIQKEVAQRITTKPPKMNLLAASVQFWAEPKIIQSVARGNFNPPPDVDSSLISLIAKSRIDADRNNTPINAGKYYKLIKIVFKQPRKTALNNLVSGGYKKETILRWFGANKIKEDCRPQDFDVNTLIKMALEL